MWRSQQNKSTKRRSGLVRFGVIIRDGRVDERGIWHIRQLKTPTLTTKQNRKTQVLLLLSHKKNLTPPIKRNTQSSLDQQ